MIKSAVGSYYYNYVISTDIGIYKVEVKATDSSSWITKKPDIFRVEASIS